MPDDVHQYHWKALGENGNAIPSDVYFLRNAVESIRYTKRLPVFEIIKFSTEIA